MPPATDDIVVYYFGHCIIKHIENEEFAMTLLEQIEQQIRQLPPEKQSELLDFALFLQQRPELPQPLKKRSLRQHPAFGSWHGRGINALQYQNNLRAEWDSPE
jgi:hypothetical protein